MADEAVTQQAVQIPTSDGTADGFLYASPEQKPGVIFLPDGIGMRDSQRQMARRLAGEGYAVLLPNIYYRSGREPFFEGPPDFTDPKTKERFGQLTGLLTADAMERDGSAYVDFLGSQSGVRPGPMGIVGYCFTGAFALRTAAARPDRIAAAASFHGGRLYNDDPASPYRSLPRVKARLYFGHAREDQGMTSEQIVRFEQALKEWGGRFESETYDARHGWTVPDSRAYDKPEAERAFVKLMELFRATLA